MSCMYAKSIDCGWCYNVMTFRKSCSPWAYALRELLKSSSSGNYVFVVDVTRSFEHVALMMPYDTIETLSIRLDMNEALA